MAKKPKQKTSEQETLLNPPKEIGDIFYGVRLDEEQKTFVNAIWNEKYDIVFCNANAGVGKTFLSAGIANLLVKYRFYSKIIYIVSPYGEHTQGWLPGSIDEKSSVYFDPFYQALKKCNVNLNTALIGNSDQKKDIKAYISCVTDTFLRGQNLDDAVVIIDEAQNYTASQLKKTLTRIGSNSKVIVIGHDKQCDLDSKKQSGFIKYLEHFRGRERAAVCTLSTNHRGWISRWADEYEEQ